MNAKNILLFIAFVFAMSLNAWAAEPILSSPLKSEQPVENTARPKKEQLRIAQMKW